MINIDIRSFGKRLARVHTEPFAGYYCAMSSIFEFNRHPAGSDQHFLPCVLTIMIGIYPMWPILAIVGADLNGGGS